MTDAAPRTIQPPVGTVLRSLFRADLAVLVRNRRALILSIVLPVALLFVTNNGTGEHRLGGALLIVGLCITYGLVSTSIMGYALSVARDRDKGVFQRLRVTPSPTWTIMASRLAVQMLANLLIALVVVIVGERLHHLDLSVTQYLLVLAVSVLSGGVFLGIGQTLVGLVRTADSVNSAGRILYMGLVFLGLLGLEGVLGPTMQTVAEWSPVGVTMSVYAGVLDVSRWSTHDTLAVVACVGYIVAGAAVGIRLFRWDSR